MLWLRTSSLHNFSLFLCLPFFFSTNLHLDLLSRARLPLYHVQKLYKNMFSLLFKSFKIFWRYIQSQNATDYGKNVSFPLECSMPDKMAITSPFVSYAAHFSTISIISPASFYAVNTPSAMSFWYFVLFLAPSYSVVFIDLVPMRFFGWEHMPRHGANSLISCAVYMRRHAIRVTRYSWVIKRPPTCLT